MAGLRNRKIIGALIAGSTLFSSTGAIAGAAPPPQPDPWAVLTLMNGGASAAAVCGPAVAGPAAAVQPVAGCVLPQIGAVPVEGQAVPPPPPPPVVAAYAPLSAPPIPVLVVLAAVLATAIYIATKGRSHVTAPNSPA